MCIDSTTTGSCGGVEADRVVNRKNVSSWIIHVRNVASSSLLPALIVANRFVRSLTTRSDSSFIISSRDVEMRLRRSSYARSRFPGVPGSFRITDRN